MSGLEALLQHCTVKLSLPNQNGWGTGFFVAPGLILTCAHVVKGGKAIQVQWQNHDLTATVEKICPAPYDIALLRVALAAEINPPCVVLDDEIRSRDPLYLFGYPDEGDRRGEPRTFFCDGVTGGEVAAILFNLGQVRPEMSGSPLLNQRTGKVCGMVKFTRDRSSNLGGGAVQACVILEQFPELRELQRAFHGGDRRWINLITTQPDIPVQPYLDAVIRDYSHQRDWYTPTDALLPLEVRSSEHRERDEQVSQPEKKVEQYPVLVGLRKYALGENREHLLLAGRPGSGKSTALQQLVVALAEEGKVPVFVRLKGNHPVPELIKAEFRRMKQRVTLEQIDEWLLNDRLVLLLDGVNEISNNELRRDLARFREENLTVPMIFTTRDLSLGGDLGIGKRLEMKPLSEPQMREFVGKYLPGQGDRLLGQLRDRLWEIAKTPLLLKMLCDVFQQTSEVPQSKGDLFRRFDAEYELFKGLPAVSEDSRRFKSELLRHLAFSMLDGEAREPQLQLTKVEAERRLEAFLNKRVNSPGQAAKEWLEDLLEHHLLQVADDPKQIEFHHQLFLEYYAAEALLEQLPTLDDKRLKQTHLNFLKWTEPLALMLALVKDQTQAERVVRLAIEVDLILAARLAGANLEFQGQMVDLIVSLEVPDWLKLELLGETRSEAAIHRLTQYLSDSNLDIVQHAVECLGYINSPTILPVLRHSLESIEEGFYHQPPRRYPDPKVDLWLTLVDIISHQSPSEVLPKLRNSVFDNTHPINWIPFLSHLPLLLQLEKKPTLCRFLDLFVNTSSPEKRTGIIEKIGQSIEEKFVLLKFIQALNNESEQIVRKSLVRAIKQSREQEALFALLELIEDLDPEVRKLAVEALIERDDTYKAEQRLQRFLNHDEWNIAWCAAIILGHIGSISALPKLAEGLVKENQNLRRAAVGGLGKLGGVQVIPLLMNALKDPDYSVRRSAAIALGNLDRHEARPELINALNHYLPEQQNPETQTTIQVEDSSITIQGMSTEDLSQIGDQESMKLWLLEYTFGQSERENVIRALGKLRIEEPLQNLLLTQNDGWQVAAIMLVKNGKKEAISQLISALDESRFKLSIEIIDLLKHQESISTLEHLRVALNNATQNRNSYLLRRILTVIAEGNTEISSRFLPDLSLLLTDKNVKEALWAVSSIQSRCKFYNYEVYQDYLEAQMRKSSNSHVETLCKQLTPINIGSVGNLNTGSVNIHGNQIGEQTP